MYDIYLDTMLCPIAPEKIELKINNKNKTVTLIDEGEINVLKKPGLTDISFDLLLPNVKYPFAQYDSGFKNAQYFLEILEDLKTQQEPFMFKIIRRFPDGKMLFDTNMKVSLEDYSPSDDKGEGFDMKVSVKLKQFRDYGTKTCKVKKQKNKKPKAKKPKKPRPTKNKPKTNNRVYTVKSGDCLWSIAKKYYGNGSQWKKIYNANTKVCGKPYTKGGTTYVMIHPGDKLTIP